MPKNGSDNRRFIRVKPSGLVARTAKLILDPKAPVVECGVSDISSGGACLEFTKPVTLPKYFELLHGGLRKKCFLVWQKGFRAGVGF
ncbi:MAG: PilZ domain-containing protein [Xanthobacteraceae bacterium]|nr:PilZ domain-containing protein [Xanthobacteraceae bacterium]QYK46039.1 MAG: PilZ domain-containing protein [Xanthobacteraceae bacterium]HMN51953.1 PilZ domain-containing protein [Xanthobacteraceae bacterium]